VLTAPRASPGDAPWRGSIDWLLEVRRERKLELRGDGCRSQQAGETAQQRALAHWRRSDVGASVLIFGWCAHDQTAS